MSDARSWRSSGSSRTAGGPIRPTVAPGGEPHRLATVAGLRLVGGASKALSGCSMRIAGGRTRTGSEFAKNSSRTSSCIKEASRMPTSQSEEFAVDARQRRADASHAQEAAHDRIGEEGLIATPFEQWKVCGKQSSASRARARFGVVFHV